MGLTWAKGGWEVHQARRWEFGIDLLSSLLLAEPAIISWGVVGDGMGY